jgi:hypothetical protein
MGRGSAAACTHALCPYSHAACIPRPAVRGAYAHLACERITGLRREPARWRRGEKRVRDRLQQRMTWCANAARGAGHSACSRQRATRTKQRRAPTKNPTSTVPTRFRPAACGRSGNAQRAPQHARAVQSAAPSVHPAPETRPATGPRAVRRETVCAAVPVGAAASGRRDGPRQRGSMHACNLSLQSCCMHSTASGARCVRAPGLQTDYWAANRVRICIWRRMSRSLLRSSCTALHRRELVRMHWSAVSCESLHLMGPSGLRNRVPVAKYSHGRFSI